MSTSRANNFDLLRLAAAALVLVSHAYAVTDRTEPLTSLSGRSLGHLGVLVFFAMSGFLVTKSWLSDPRLPAYLAKRALRLGPALIAALLVCAFLLGPVVTTTPVADYFTRSEPYRYVAQNALLRTSFQSLPGVFEGNPYTNSVNGSLWTLWWEALAYLGVLALGLAGILRLRRNVLAIAAAVLGAAAVASIADAPPPAPFWLIMAFAAGALLFLFRDTVRPRGWVAVGLVGLWVATWRSSLDEVTMCLAVAYVALYLALLPQFRVTRWLQARIGDASYGVYLYAFPVEQLVVHVAGPEISPAAVIALAAPVTFACAVLSWRFVEAPALRLKWRVARAVTPLPGETAAPPAVVDVAPELAAPAHTGSA